VSQENLEADLLHIREAAREYYARKKGTWKPKRDLDAEKLEDGTRLRIESMMFGGSIYSTMRMMRYVSGPVRIEHVSPDPAAIERIRKSFEMVDLSALEDRMRRLMSDKFDRVIVDELPTSRRIPEIPELKEYQHKYLYGDWKDRTKLGAGKNPMAEHTILAVKKSHRKRRFSQKSK
jgi:hypothetical protein